MTGGGMMEDKDKVRHEGCRMWDHGKQGKRCGTMANRTWYNWGSMRDRHVGMWVGHSSELRGHEGKQERHRGKGGHRQDAGDARDAGKMWGCKVRLKWMWMWLGHVYKGWEACMRAVFRSTQIIYQI